MPPNTQNRILLQDSQSLRFELVEVPVDASAINQTKFGFPTNNNLQGKRVLFVDAYSAETMGKTPMGRDVIPVSVFLRSFLTMYTTEQQKQNIQQLPFTAMNPYYVPGGVAPNTQARMLLNNEETDWNKCIIDTGTPIGISGVSFILGVYYVNE